MDIPAQFFDEWFDGLVVYDRALNIVAANAAAGRLFDRARGDLVGRTNGDLEARAAELLDPLIIAAFDTGRAVAGHLEPFGAHVPLRVSLRADGDLVFAILHRMTDDDHLGAPERARELDVAMQMLAFHTEHSPLAVIRWDDAFRVVEWSPRAREIFGWSSAEAIGKSIDELGLVYEPDRAAVQIITDEFQKLAIRANVSENRNLTKNCEIISCRWFNSHVKIGDTFGVLSLVEDVTESVNARRAAGESEQRFRSMFDYSPDPMLSLALDGTITRANSAAGESHGCTSDAMVGRSVTDFIATADLPRAVNALRDAADGNAGTIEVIALRPSDTYPISASFIPIVLEGRISGVHLVARDLTNTKRAERAIATQAERIRELYLVSAAANATAERQIVATIDAGCRLLGMASGVLYESDGDREVASVGPTLARPLMRLSLATDGALGIEDLRGIPYLGEVTESETPVAAYIGTPIDVAGTRYGSLIFGNPEPRSEPFGSVDRDLVQLMGALIGSAIERGRARAHLKHLAYNDQLTALPNRASLMARLKEELELAAERGTRVGVMFLDLDRFKDINDTLGHALGDRLLRVVGERLTRVVGSDGIVARMGGDEFIVCAPFDPDAEALASLAERIVACIDVPMDIEGYEQYVTTSVGVAIYPSDGGDADTLVKHADIAMYRAKERGRNTHQFFTPALNASLRTRLSQEKSLRKALERNEFVVHYQPQIDLVTEEIVGVEALVRWQHPRLGLVSPDQFIPSAELSGLIVPLGDWVLETAARAVREWRANGYPRLRVAVNLSARQFHQTHLAAKIRDTLARVMLDTDALELEITESVAMNDAALSAQIMQELGDAGIRLSVDDFGTGYSSLGYLRRFPLDSIKIDQSFVRDIMTEPDDATIVRTVIGMAHSLGLEVVAEGVETAEQLDFLRRERCDRVQGFYFSRAVAATEFASLLSRYRAVPSIVG